MQLVRGETRRFGDLVLRRGSEFFEEVEVVDPPSATNCYEAVDLNASSLRTEIRTGSDTGGSLVATFVNVPLNLTGGNYGYGVTGADTDAFSANLSIGTAYYFVDDVVLGSRNVRVKDPDDP